MSPPLQGERVVLEACGAELDGMLWLPQDANGMILFVNAATGSRIRPPGDYVASVLRQARLATLWVDLLTVRESARSMARSDIALLAMRLHAYCDWLRQNEATADLPLGLYGVGHGAAAMMQVAASRKDIAAVVSRSGRPDLAGHQLLSRVRAPALLIAGGLDTGAIDMNRAAYASLRGKKRFEIIPGATHAFCEAGSLEVVARMARTWFLQHFFQPAAGSLPTPGSIQLSDARRGFNS